MNTSTWADNTSLAAAINDGHLPPPELVRDLVNDACDRLKTNATARLRALIRYCNKRQLKES